MNKIVKLAIVLFLVCAITAGILGAVYVITEEKIAYQNELKKTNAYAAVLPSDSYETVTSYDSAAIQEQYKVKITAVSSCDDGYVVESSFSGAQGTITMACGVSKDYKCTGISIISHSETSGLGANAASTAEVGVNFRAQFVGQGSDIALSKNGGSIDALTGATITSKSVTNAAAASIAVVKSLG